MIGLTPAFVRQCFQEAAERWAVSFDDVVGRARYGAALAARREAVKRVAEETGALPYQIARAWGADHTVVAACLAAPPSTIPYDPRTVAQLAWLHGPERAANIIAGVDIEAELDRALWRGIGRGVAA